MNLLDKDLWKIYLHGRDNEYEKIQEVIEDGKVKFKAIFHPKAFIFGWFYLLYRRLTIEALGILIFSLILFKISPIIGLLFGNIVPGFYYYYLLASKFERDLEKAGKPIDKEKLASLSKPSFLGILIAISIILFLTWPIIYAIVTGYNIVTPESQQIPKIPFVN